MPMPKPMPVLMEVSRFLTTAAMASRCSGCDLAGGDQVVDEFVNRFPAIGGPQIGDDLLFAQECRLSP